MTYNQSKSYHRIPRRSFLKLFSVSLLGSHLSACTHKKFFNPDENIILSGGNFTERGTEKNALIAVNLHQTEKRVIETPFLPHSIQINPDNKYSIFCFEKNGRNACEVDLQTQSLIRNFQAETGYLFSGHASFNADGKKIICVESNIENQQGNICIRDTRTFDVIQRLPTLGLAPHDCQLSADNILTVSNTGQSESGFHQPSLVSIDLESEKLIQRIKLKVNNLNCGHFKFAANKDLVISSANINSTDETLPGGVSIRKKNETIATMTEPELVIKRMIGEALSIEINQQQSIAAITHPEANLLTFWSIKDKKIIKAFGMEKPRGLSQTLDEKNFIVSYGNKPAMVKISINDLSPQPESIVQPTLASGEHIINWSKKLRKIMPKHIYD